MGAIKTVYLLSGDSYHHRKSRDPLIRVMLNETGRPVPSVAYIGTASGDDPLFTSASRQSAAWCTAIPAEMVELTTSETSAPPSLFIPQNMNIRSKPDHGKKRMGSTFSHFSSIPLL